MYTQIDKVFLNENLLQIILPFLSINDIINFTSSNKKIRENNDKIFNEICKQIYTSSYDEYSILNTQIEDNNERKSDELNIESNLYLKIKWKSFFLIGKKIQFLWKKISFEQIESFKNDSIKFSSEFFSTLKEFWSIPPLRKQNLYVENELNTAHQIYLYDYLYEQQEIYDFYYKQINNDVMIDENIEIKCRRESCLFSNSLKKYNLFTDLDENDMNILEHFRFYSLPNEEFQFYNLNQKQMNDKCINFEKNFTEYFKEIYKERIGNKKGNPLITLLITLYLSISFFCMFQYLEIINSKNYDFLLLDNFIKRYKSFVDGAININKNLENLNVIINLIYEQLFTGNKSIEPKFSIYRLMLILYNRIIINPLSDETQNKNIIKITSNIYDIYLKEEIRKIECCDNNKILFNNSLSTTKSSSFGNYEDLINNLYSLTDINDIENFDADFQIIQFLENIPSILIDSICDEYSVFYINSTNFPIYGNYKKLQDSLIKITNDNFMKFPNLICNQKLIIFINENEFINEKLINLTKINICKSIYKQILINSLRELNKIIINDNIIINPVMRRNNNNFIRNKLLDFNKCKILYFFNYLVPLKNELDEILSYVNKEKSNENEDEIQIILCNYSKKDLCKFIEESNVCMRNLLEMQEENDKNVKKETTRRNILFTKKIYNQQLWSFNFNINLDKVMDLINPIEFWY